MKNATTACLLLLALQGCDTPKPEPAKPEPPTVIFSPEPEQLREQGERNRRLLHETQELLKRIDEKLEELKRLKEQERARRRGEVLIRRTP